MHSAQIKARRSKTKDRIAAILLAAGRSRRMGRFKPLLPFGDKTVIETCINKLRGAGIDEIIVVVGHRADEIKDRVSSDVKFAINSDSESEMSVSIARGVEQVSDKTKAVLIALVDHPAVSTGTIEEIIQEWRRGASLVQPKHRGRGGHPVLIDMRYRDEFLNVDSSQGLRGFFEAHRGEVSQLAVDSPYVARDMDTWEDYLRLHQEVFGKTPPVDFHEFS